ncbi:MAG: hypothetical protein HDT13_04815 [Butyrivibrio sp.]|nr:hypothetical protein [Butyrivibrio sp.]
MLIDVSDTNAIPVDIEQKIMSYFALMSERTIADIKNQKLEYDRDVLCAIEKYVSPYTAYDFYQELISLFDQYEIVCYHSTKILDKSIILLDGLKTNDWSTYSRNIINTFKRLNVKENNIGKAIKAIKKQYDWKYPSFDREPQLCFYSDVGQLSSDMTAGYEQFCENIGGELARDALKIDYPQIYRYLRENGDAILVKFKIPFIDVKSYDKVSVAYHFVAYFAGKYFWNYNYEIHFHGNTDKDIAPNNILEIIPYTVDRYYFHSNDETEGEA